MKIRKININTKNRKYPILIGSNLIKNLKNILKNNSINSSKYLLVIDTKVPKKLVELTKKNLDTKAIIYRFVSSEKNKNFNKLNHILNILLKENFNRNDSIIAVGGGIVGDVAAFAASIRVLPEPAGPRTLRNFGVDRLTSSVCLLSSGGKGMLADILKSEHLSHDRRSSA